MINAMMPRTFRISAVGPSAVVRCIVAVFIGGLVVCANWAVGQDRARFQLSSQAEPNVDLFPSITTLESAAVEDDAEPVVLLARYSADASGVGRLDVEAMLSPNWHIYSTTQPAGGPSRTRIIVTGPSTVSVTGDFVPDQEPARSVSSVYNGLTIEEHEGIVVWSAPISVPPGFVEPIELSVNALVCRADDEAGRCLPVREKITAQHRAGAGAADGDAVALTQAPAAAVPPKLKPFRDKKYVVEWTAEVVPPNPAPGQSASIKFTAHPDQGFHVYKAAVDDSESSTNFVLTKKSDLLIGAPVADKQIISKAILPGTPPIQYYGGKVTFVLPIKVPSEVAAGRQRIEGMIAYQACTDTSCHRPTALKFAADIDVGAPGGKPVEFQFASAKSADALDAAAETNWVDPIKPADAAAADDDDEVPVAAGGGGDVVPLSQSTSSFAVLLGLAFLGGLILNVMPCVLPVVGLKIMGFVSQAGEDRKRVLLLNMVYVLGIMSIFAVLALVAGFSKFGWGQQFTYFEVKFGLTILMFALALSYLGVWEIPAPGMAGGKTSSDLQNREGLVGAFSKGVFATILSTPCSGPLLGYILGATLNFTPLQTIAIMLTVGFGMSSPYLLIGAFPSLVAWLPKPGPWMETLKQLMAFLFLGTVAYFFAQFNDDQKVPVFVSLIAVWFGCWIIGQVPNWAEMRRRASAWLLGIASACLISFGAFHYLQPNDQLAWRDYDEVHLTQLRNQGRTVLLDFSAKWCATCQLNYAVAINTAETRQVLDELGGVAMYADWTDHNDQIKQKLEELDSRSIPLLAIYPGSRPNRPIILRDVVTQQDVIQALRQAGASVQRSTAARRSEVSIAASH